jgi:hypothetical protein
MTVIISCNVGVLKGWRKLFTIGLEIKPRPGKAGVYEHGTSV